MAADNRFAGSILVVTGTLDSIDKDFMGDIVLKLKTGEIFKSAHVELVESEVPKAAALSKGSQITVVCSGGVRLTMGSPFLDDCVIR